MLKIKAKTKSKGRMEHTPAVLSPERLRGEDQGLQRERPGTQAINKNKTIDPEEESQLEAFYLTHRKDTKNGKCKSKTKSFQMKKHLNV